MHSKIKLRTRLAFILSIALCLLSSQLHAEDPITAKIIDGTLRSSTEYPMVAQLNIADSVCTGTLVGASYVLTAAHCFYDENSNRITDTSLMSAVLGGNTFAVRKVNINPSYVSGNEACVANQIDAAVIELKSSVSNVSPVPLNRSEAVVGTQLLLVGFGIQGNGATGENDTFPEEGLVNIGYTTLERVSDNLYVDWNFDAGESNTAGGDSGGPAFMDVGGVRYINSITCGGTGKAQHGTQSTNTRADAIASWVDSIIAGGSSGGSTSLQASKVKVDFGDNDEYTFFASGSIDLGKNFAPKNTNVKIKLASTTNSFKLSQSGSAQRKGGYDYIALKGSMNKGKFKSSKVKFEIGLGDKESFFKSISKLFPEDTSSLPASYRVELPITVEIKGKSYSTTVSLKSQRNGERWVK